MKKSLLILFFSLSIFISNAQNWNHVLLAGGTGNDIAKAVATDNIGNIYSAGHYSSDPFIIGALILPNAGQSDVYIMKQDVTGSVLWVNYFGGIENEEISALKTDAIGNTYIAGFFLSDSIHIGNETLINLDSSSSTGDAFLAKIDSMGNFDWVIGFHGNDEDRISSLACDPSGNLIISGTFDSDTLYFNNNSLAIINYYSMFVAKFDPSGNMIFAKTNQAGAAAESSVTTDVNGDIYITGDYADTIFTFDNLSINNISYMGWTSDLYIAKLNSAGVAQWLKKFGGGDYDFQKGIAVAPSGIIYITGGYYSDSISFDAHVLENLSPGGNDYYFAAYDQSGNALWARAIDSSLGEGHSIITDMQGNIIVAGYFYGTDAVFGNVTLPVGVGGNAEAFVAIYDSTGAAVSAFSIAGPSGEYVNSLTIDQNNNIILAGNVDGTPLTFDQTTFNIPLGNNFDLFVASYRTNNTSCNASFTIYPDTSMPNHHFIVENSSGTGIVSWDWNWGDGSTDNIQFPTHVYSDTGYYTVCLTIMDTLGCSDTYCDSSYFFSRSLNPMAYVSVVANLPTSINDLELSDTYIFPNPAREKIYIKSGKNPEDRILEIYNYTGCLIMNKKLKNEIEEIDLNNISSGIYQFIIRSSEGVRKLKAVKI